MSVIAPVPFECGLRENGADSADLRPSGELSLVTAPQLERALEQAQSHARLVVLHLRELDFMDSAGVHAIVDAHERAQRDGGRLVIVSGARRVDMLFDLTGTRDVLDIVVAHPPA